MKKNQKLFHDGPEGSTETTQQPNAETTQSPAAEVGASENASANAAEATTDDSQG